MPQAQSAFLKSRGIRSVAELGAAKPHGTRLRYMAGCHCDACRKANSSYENVRKRARLAGDWNGIVPAARARAHMQKLSEQGVGRRAVQAASDIAETILCEIRTGKRKNIRARTERQILAVTPASASDHALIDSAPTKALIAELLEEGYTEERLAKELGYANRYLQFHADTITVKNADRVRRLHERLTT